MGFLKGFRAGVAAAKRAEKFGELVPVKGPQLPQRIASPASVPAVRDRLGREVAPAPSDAPLVEYDEPDIVAAVPVRGLVFAHGAAVRRGRRAHGHTLYMIGNEKPDGQLAGSGWQPGFEHYAIDAAPEWRCPWCGVREDPRHDFLRLVWACGSGCGEPLHCCGSKRGLFRCACGQRCGRSFHRVDVFKVYEFNGLRGASARGVVHTRT